MNRKEELQAEIAEIERKEAEEETRKLEEAKRINEKIICEGCHEYITEGIYYFCVVHKTIWCVGCATNEGRRDIYIDKVRDCKKIYSAMPNKMQLSSWRDCIKEKREIENNNQHTST